MFYSGQQVYTQLILLCFQSLYQCPWEHPGSSWMAFIEVILVSWALRAVEITGTQTSNLVPSKWGKCRILNCLGFENLLV